eukprot:CAMPEP_0202699178 /NCGR_PEP_ID=MMETSP1385-20130828/12400_1 /ASSEMBLY_ACC=CAM_ASM_000861 /TAXON_ID=933848 /ORGANISM="Elphidium margaritaceum" /LENGTH=53 /DNA_ID=CAMNT_0049356055 /DNA_START=63 /DNA_END=221 /DNA_ORIENTATION=-
MIKLAREFTAGIANLTSNQDRNQRHWKLAPRCMINAGQQENDASNDTDGVHRI